MDPQRHAQLSARRHGGEPKDYLPLHSAMDATKELCSDNRHRWLHTLWGIRRVILPMVGPTLTVEGQVVRTKMVLEHDHVLPDFARRFIPTLADFVEAVAPDGDERARFRSIHERYADDDDTMRLLLSPYFVTGEVRALLITHNSWFLGEVLPRIRRQPPRLSPRGVAPSELFARMSFRLWMDNGAALPPSSPEHRLGGDGTPCLS